MGSVAKNLGNTTCRARLVVYGPIDSVWKSFCNTTQITVTPHKYVQKGYYLTFIPKDAADQKYRLIFETDEQKVTQFRADQLPEVAFIERCA